MHGYVSGVVDSLKIGGSAGGGSIILEERVPSKAERLAGSSSLSPVTKYAWRLRPRNGDTHARCARVRCRAAPKVIEVTAEQVKTLLCVGAAAHMQKMDANT